jgi:hypothetical protein
LTLLTPLVTIIGLYSNVPEGGRLAPEQISWFEQELENAPKNLPVIVAVHHPLFSAYGQRQGLHRASPRLVEHLGRTGFAQAPPIRRTNTQICDSSRNAKKSLRMSRDWSMLLSL